MHQDLGGETKLHVAASNNRLPEIQRLLDDAEELGILSELMDKADISGWTPLCIASYKGHLEIVQLLLLNGAAIDKTNNYGYTPLSVASSWGHLEVVKVLLKYNANLHIKDNDGKTALDWTREQGQDRSNYRQDRKAKIEEILSAAGAK